MLALRMWLVLVVAVLGLGAGSRTGSGAPAFTQVASQGLHTSPLGPSSPGELPEEQLPLRSEGEDAKDAKDAEDSEDAQRRRVSASALALGPCVGLHLAASVTWLRFATARHVGPGCAHRSQLHNRGPPVA